MEKTLVSVWCTVYNHEKFLRQCLEGFVMQKTEFPFEVIVHDDVSTDHSVDIIREYAARRPDIIKPIFETENQYSKGDARIFKIMNKASNGKYVAICEGDDYWTDPLKLQKQVSYLESHRDCTMVCCRAKLYSERKQEIVGEVASEKKSCTLLPKNIILKGGEYIATAGIVYRKEVRENYPDYCKKCYVGDYPLQIMSAMLGKVYYFNDSMAVYRIDNGNSWSGREATAERLIDIENIKKRSSLQEMLKGFSIDYPKYKSIFKNRIAYTINISINRRVSKEKAKLLCNIYKSYIRQYPLIWKIDLFIRRYTPNQILGIYTKTTYELLLRQYHS